MYKTKHTMVILCIVHNVILPIYNYSLYIYIIIFHHLIYTTINKLLFLCEKNS